MSRVHHKTKGKRQNQLKFIRPKKALNYNHNTIINQNPEKHAKGLTEMRDKDIPEKQQLNDPKKRTTLYHKQMLLTRRCFEKAANRLIIITNKRSKENNNTNDKLIITIQ